MCHIAVELPGHCLQCVVQPFIAPVPSGHACRHIHHPCACTTRFASFGADTVTLSPGLADSQCYHPLCMHYYTLGKSWYQHSDKCCLALTCVPGLADGKEGWQRAGRGVHGERGGALEPCGVPQGACSACAASVYAVSLVLPLHLYPYLISMSSCVAFSSTLWHGQLSHACRRSRAQCVLLASLVGLLRGINRGTLHGGSLSAGL